MQDKDELRTVKVDFKKQMWDKGVDMIFKKEIDKIKKDAGQPKKLGSYIKKSK